MDKKKRQFLDEPAGVCYCFSELPRKTSLRFLVGDRTTGGFRDFREMKWRSSH